MKNNKSNKHPEDNDLSYLSRLTFSYYDDIINQGDNKYITEDDIFDVKEKDKAKFVLEKQNKTLDKNIFMRIIKSHGLLLLSGALFLIPEIILSFTSPFLLKDVVNFIVDSKNIEKRGDLYIGIIYSFLLLIVPILESIFFHQYVNIVGISRNRVKNFIIIIIDKSRFTK
jgi:ATP-binding cassette subfamily C (CFTR/MRP) protein 1